MCHDFRATTTMLTAKEQQQVRDELDQVVVTSAKVIEPVDVTTAKTATTSTKAATKPKIDLEQLARELLAAMTLHLESKLAELSWKDDVVGLAMTTFEGAGRAAKLVVDAEFARWVAAAALTDRGRLSCQEFAFRGSTGDGQNLFEATDREGRRSAGVPVDARDTALWIAANDPACQRIKRAHQFSTTSQGGAQFLDGSVIKPFLSQHHDQLERYDLLGFAITNPDARKVVIAGKIKPGAGPKAERIRQWEVFKQLTHEYLHTQQHPNIPEATSSGVVKEGFCELFTQDVILPVLRAIGQGQRPDLVLAVQGGEDPQVDPEVVGGYQTPEDYVDCLRHAKNIRTICGPNAMRSAFFQGHVELLGLKMNGDPYPAAPDGAESFVAVPNGITTVAALAEASNVSAVAIREANPKVGDTVTAGQLLNLPGCREHILVLTRDEYQEDATIESPELIATQHGITLDAFYRANPALPRTNRIADPDEAGHLLIPHH